MEFSKIFQMLMQKTDISEKTKMFENDFRHPVDWAYTQLEPGKRGHNRYKSNYSHRVLVSN